MSLTRIGENEGLVRGEAPGRAHNQGNAERETSPDSGPFPVSFLTLPLLDSVKSQVFHITGQKAPVKIPVSCLPCSPGGSEPARVTIQKPKYDGIFVPTNCDLI
jgi:hypothetical protein